MATRGPRSLAKWQRDAVRRMVAVRKDSLAFLKRLPEDAILRPRTQDQWSVKDVLGHLMSCDEETTRRFKLIARGQADRIAWFESMTHANRFNARTVAAARRLSLRAVRRRMARAHADLIKSFKKLPPESLNDPSHDYPVISWLPAPGWNHEREHVGEIKAWWRGHRSRRSRPVF
ncbi:MAG: DinB family protein [Candidatus Rokubacteria bacterium]|nr:DinB family protein [Candidatus Rokubacteria bacterium]